MEKFNPYVRQNSASMRQLQVVYLICECGLSIHQTAEITDYALSTVRNYANKYADELNLAKRYFAEEQLPLVASVKKCLRGGQEVEMQYLEGCGEDIPGEGVVYLFKFYQPNDIISSKIGTTVRSIDKRLPEEIARYIVKNGWNIKRVEICKIISTQGVKPTLVESALRSEFGIEYGDSFIDNDRFMGVDLSVEQFTDIVYTYLRRKGKKV